MVTVSCGLLSGIGKILKAVPVWAFCFKCSRLMTSHSVYSSRLNFYLCPIHLHESFTIKLASERTIRIMVRIFFFFCSRLGSTNTQQLTLFRPIKLTLTKQACDFVLVDLTCRPTIDIATIWLVASPGRIFSSGRCAMSMSTFCQSYLSENVPRSKS